MIIEKFTAIDHKYDKHTGSIKIKNETYQIEIKNKKVFLSSSDSSYSTEDPYIKDNMTITSSLDQKTISLSVFQDCKIIIKFSLVEKIYVSTHRLNFENHLTIQKSDFDYVGLHRLKEQNKITKILNGVDSFTYNPTESKKLRMNYSNGGNVHFRYDDRNNKYTYTDVGI
jgi:hypothetical protein